MPRAILVTDFDGTLARTDFYFLMAELFLPRGVPNYYAEYARGRLTHFESLAATYTHLRASEADLAAALPRLDVEPRLTELLPRMREAGWEVVVASAGCAWYIDRLLAGTGLTVHANRGHYDPARGLVMELPTDSPFFSPTVGIDKPAVVRDALARADVVAFAGDGYTDAPAARLVRPELRFAKAECAATLASLGEGYRAFDWWGEVADALLAEGW